MIWTIFATIAMALPAIDVDSLMMKIDKNMNYSDRRAQIEMVVKKGRRVKQYQLVSMGRGKTDSAIEVMSPPREKGLKILKKQSDVWIYLPSIERIQKISGHMLKQGMLGSDMSYDDMMTSTALQSNYDAELVAEQTRDGKECYQLIFTRRQNSTAYHKRISYIDKQKLVPVYEELYSESGMLLKTWKYENVGEHNGRQFPRKMIIRDALQSNSTTTIEFHELEFDVEIPAAQFKRRWLSR